MFLTRAQEKHAAPEQLESLVSVVKPQSWLLLATTAGLLLAAAAWAWLGRVPITVRGDGLLVYPTTVVALMAPATGKVIELHVQPGARVVAGVTVIATLELEDLQNQIAAEESRLADLVGREDQLTTFERERAVADRRFYAEKIVKLEQRITTLRGLLADMRAADVRFEQRQAQALEQARSLSADLAQALEERIAAHAELVRQGLSTEEQLLDARSKKIENELRLAELSVRASELELRQSRAEQAYMEHEDMLRELELELMDVRLAHDDVARRLREAEIDSESLVREAETRLRLLRDQERKREVKSDRSGIVLETTVSPGELVPIGRRLCSIRAQDESKPLMALAFFDVRDGKRIEQRIDGRAERRETRITPTTVRRESYGSIVGHVAFTDPERGEDWGVEAVSQYPITTAAAANEIGSLELAQNLLGGENRIRVWSVLERSDDPRALGGYRWTSGTGPPERMAPALTAGTTLEMRVLIHRVAPIDLVIPFLRTLIEGDAE
jgi:HlyD family secretion protein